MKLFQGDNYIDNVFFGESVYTPLHDPMFALKSDPKPDQLAQWRRMAMEIAKAGLPLHVHAELHEHDRRVPRSDRGGQQGVSDQEPALDAGPRQPAQRVAARAHEEAGHVCRRASVGGHQRRDHARRVRRRRLRHAAARARFRTAASCGDSAPTAPRPIRYLPFTTLYFAVTGKMAAARRCIRQTISREDALIAHTRKNAFFVFQENNLGSIQPGKLADLVVLDRDYLTIPADQIKDIKPVMTMVGGRIVYDARQPFPRHDRWLMHRFNLCACPSVRADRWPVAGLAVARRCRRRTKAKTAEQVYKNIKALKGHARQPAESVDAPDEGRRRPGLPLLPHRARVGKGRQAAEGGGARDDRHDEWTSTSASSAAGRW